MHFQIKICKKRSQDLDGLLFIQLVVRKLTGKEPKQEHKLVIYPQHKYEMDLLNIKRLKCNRFCHFTIYNVH